MSRDREGAVTASFVTLASALATGADVVDLLSTLTTDCAALLDVASAGLLLADRAGVLHVLAASSEATRDLEAFQVQRDEGPCLDCYRSGEPVGVPDLERVRERWPSFAAAAHRRGFSSVHAVPMRLRDRRLGALGLFGQRAGVLNEADLTLGQALADVASVAIAQDAAGERDGTWPGGGDPLGERLEAALGARVVVEQAKGVLSATGGLGMDAAFEVLRGYARARGRPLSAVAREVVARELAATAVLGRAGAPRT